MNIHFDDFEKLPYHSYSITHLWVASNPVCLVDDDYNTLYCVSRASIHLGAIIRPVVPVGILLGVDSNNCFKTLLITDLTLHNGGSAGKNYLNENNVVEFVCLHHFMKKDTKLLRMY